jgi:predicted ester cyclase
VSVEENNIAAIRRWLEEGWSKGNLAVADEMIDGSFSVHGAGGQVVRSGPEGAKQLVAAWRAAFSDGRMTVDDIFAEGDMVVIRMTWTGTHSGEFYGRAPSGRPVSVTSIGIDRLVNGKVVEGWGELDMLGLYQQIGALPRPGAGGSATTP